MCSADYMSGVSKGLVEYEKNRKNRKKILFEKILFE
jgi:hypothetical protein